MIRDVFPNAAPYMYRFHTLKIVYCLTPTRMPLREALREFGHVFNFTLQMRFLWGTGSAAHWT